MTNPRVRNQTCNAAQTTAFQRHRPGPRIWFLPVRYSKVRIQSPSAHVVIPSGNWYDRSMNTLSIKLDSPLENVLLKLSKQERVTKSELVRRALHAYASQRMEKVPARSALDLAGDLVGCIKDGSPDLSSNPRYLDDFGTV
jgi:predicted DNA-binding protein